MQFLGIGPFELMLLVIIALVVIGPERLPEVIRSVMRTIAQLRRLSSDFTSEFSELSNEFKDIGKELAVVDPEKMLKQAEEELKAAERSLAETSAEIKTEIDALQTAEKTEATPSPDVSSGPTEAAQSDSADTSTPDEAPPASPEDSVPSAIEGDSAEIPAVLGSGIAVTMTEPSSTDLEPSLLDESKTPVVTTSTDKEAAEEVESNPADTNPDSLPESEAKPDRRKQTTPNDSAALAEDESPDEYFTSPGRKGESPVNLAEQKERESGNEETLEEQA